MEKHEIGAIQIKDIMKQDTVLKHEGQRRLNCQIDDNKNAPDRVEIQVVHMHATMTKNQRLQQKHTAMNSLSHVQRLKNLVKQAITVGAEAHKVSRQ